MTATTKLFLATCSQGLGKRKQGQGSQQADSAEKRLRYATTAQPKVF